MRIKERDLPDIWGSPAWEKLKDVYKFPRIVNIVLYTDCAFTPSDVKEISKG